mgnify:CR=1 FL=1
MYLFFVLLGELPTAVLAPLQPMKHSKSQKIQYNDDMTLIMKITARGARGTC